MKILEKLYLNEYILSYSKINNLLQNICSNNKNIKNECIGKTAFGYDINSFKIGNGQKHILIIGGTHGCEIVTVYFNIEFLFTILNDIKIQKE